MHVADKPRRPTQATPTLGLDFDIAGSEAEPAATAPLEKPPPLINPSLFLSLFISIHSQTLDSGLPYIIPYQYIYHPSPATRAQSLPDTLTLGLESAMRLGAASRMGTYQ